VKLWRLAWSEVTFERFHRVAWLLIAAALVYAVFTSDHTVRLDVTHRPADVELDRLLGR